MMSSPAPRGFYPMSVCAPSHLAQMSLNGFNLNHLNLLDAAVVAGINVSEVGPFLPFPSEFTEMSLTIYIILLQLQEPVTCLVQARRKNNTQRPFRQ